MNQPVSHNGPDDPVVDVFASAAVLAPRGRDAAVMGQLLSRDGIDCIAVSGLEELGSLVNRHVGVVLITEEALAGAGFDQLIETLSAQPTWSDTPFVVLTNGSVRNRSKWAGERLDQLRNALLLSRPLHADELVRAVKSALKARARQHEARKHMEKLQLREQQLYESEAKFHAIADSVNQMIWSTRPDGFHDYFNHRWYEFTGVPNGSTDGHAWSGIFHEDDQDQTWATWRHSLETGEPYEVEYRLRHHSGKYRWVLGRAHPVRGEDGKILRWYGSCTDIHDIKVAEEQRQLMLGEMNHRVKNTMAMVNAMVSQTLRQAENLTDAQVSIQSRISMMAHAHDRLIKSSWAETQVPEVVEAALTPHRTGEGRFSIAGPSYMIGAKQALALTMALHELSTNANKYGALSVAGGGVQIEWGSKTVDGEDRFYFCWAESGGPMVSAPTRKGFGSRMIEQALAAYFNGSAELIYDSNGLKFNLVAPLSGLTA
jgi:PAS domain S-box-containing protein